MTDEIKVIPIDQPIPHPVNGRKGNVAKIAASIERFGQVTPIVIQQSTGYVVKGNHTLAAMQSLGKTEIKALFKDMDDTEAAAYLLADNRTSDFAKYEVKSTLELLQPLLEDDMLEGTGYDIDDIEAMQDELGGNEVDTDTEIKRYEGHIKPTTDADGSQVEEPKKERMKDILLLMPVSVALEFGMQIAELQKVYGTSTVAETVRKAVAQAVAFNKPSQDKQATGF